MLQLHAHNAAHPLTLSGRFLRYVPTDSYRLGSGPVMFRPGHATTVRQERFSRSDTSSASECSSGPRDQVVTTHLSSVLRAETEESMM